MKQRRPRIQAPESFERPWLRSERPVPRLVVRPLERFLRLEAGSASLLMAAAIAALVWANLAPGSYERLWTSGVTVDFGPLSVAEDLRHVVNDLLMALFFFVVALEVKRELLFGSLRDRAAASVPVAAAAGTMVGAAAVYVSVNLIGDGDLSGWAIPIATDIAFALGVLGLVGGRAPGALRPFMLTLAVVDDIATIVVIALFYSGAISLGWLGVAVACTVAIPLLRRLQVRFLAPYIALAALLWLAVFESGIHATIAGVVLGFLTPAVALHGRRATAEVVGEQLTTLSELDDDLSESAMWEAARLTRESVSPLTRLEIQVHPWSTYVVLPLFALANAGVVLSLDSLSRAFTRPVGLGIALGLVVGAPLGGFCLAWAVVRLSPARLQEGLDWPAIAGVAPLKGIGFTVAIFIAVLAFSDPALQEEAKIAILVGSAVAALIGLGVLLSRHALAGSREAAD